MRPVRSALLGRRVERSAAAVGVAVALALAAFALGSVLPDPVARAAFESPAFAVAVLGLTALAGASAAWNGGVVVSWLLVFAPVSAWLWALSDPAFGRSVHDDPVDVLERALYPTTLAFGTLGHAGGRVVASLHHPPPAERAAVAPLLGRDRAVAARCLELAGVLLVAGFGAGAVAHRVAPSAADAATGLFDVLVLAGADPRLGVPVALAGVGLAAWATYRTGGVLPGWALVFGPAFGALLHGALADGSPATGPGGDAFVALVTAVVFATVLGSAGFVVGRAGRLR